ncbi:unnamed protein product [Closterium sp. Yama58-4]|nr:unnamed protein product [Closterium sp. Yama58-4]
MKTRRLASPPPFATKPFVVRSVASVAAVLVAFSLVSYATAAGSSGKKCDVTVGSWVPSSKYPQYQNDCPYITDNFNCIKNGRPDGDFQHLVWKPNGCDLTLFDPKSFAARFVGQAVAIAGDSTGQYLYQSLRCRISQHYTTEDWDPKLVGWTGQGFKVKLLGTRVLLVDTPFLMEAWPDVEGESKASNLWHVQLGTINHKILEMLPNIPQLKALILVASNYFLPQPATTTISVNNSAYSSYISNQRIYYSQGKPISPQPTPQDALSTALKAISGYFDKNFQLVRPFFLTMPPSHNPNMFRYAATTCGLFASPLQADAMRYAEARSDATGWTAVQRQALSGSKIKLLDILQMSMYRADGHMAAYGPPPDASEMDCVKWCLPGVPDAWVDVFFHKIVHPFGGFGPDPLLSDSIWKKLGSFGQAVCLAQPYTCPDSAGVGAGEGGDDAD